MIPSILLLRSSDPTGLLFWCVIGLCAGIYLFIQGFRLLQRRRLVLDTPVSKIRSAPLGMVELSGLAVGPYTVVAPITDRACYYFRTVAWEWKRQGKSSRWVKVAAESMHVPFFLDDNTGKLMIDPRGADLDLHRDFQQQFCDSFFTTKEAAPDNVRSFLLRHGVSTSNKIKVEEFCIKPKNALFLLGTLEENPGLEITQQPIWDEEHNTLTFGKALWSKPDSSNPAWFNLSFVTGGGNGDDGEFQHRSVSELLMGGPSSRASAPAPSPQVFRLSPDASSTKSGDMTQQQKIAAALIKAGITNPAAWAAAGVTPSAAAVHSDPNRSSHESQPHGSAQVASKPATPPGGFDPHPPVVLMKGKNNPTFLISWRSQRDLARSLAWKCTLMIWGGPALALLCLYALLNLTHSF